MPIGAAIGTAVGGIGASAIGASASSSAASQAAAAQTAANQAAIAEQQREFDTSQQNLAPWLSAGNSALQSQLALLGLGGHGATGGTAGTSDWNAYLQQNPDVQAAYNNLSPQDKARFPTAQSYAQYHYDTYGQNEGRALPTTGGTAASGALSAADAQQQAITGLQNSPLYQSLYRNGQDTILNNAAATGGLRGGNTQRSLANFGADTLSSVIQNQLANLGGISNTGNSTANSLATLGSNTSNNISGLLANNGSAQAGGILAQAGINNNAINGISSSLGGLLGNSSFQGIFGGSGSSSFPSFEYPDYSLSTLSSGVSGLSGFSGF